MSGTKPWQPKLAAAWALPAAYQWWLAYDAHFTRSLENQPAALNEDWVREIARPYGIGRTLGGERYDKIARRISLLHLTPGTTMVERASATAAALRDWEGRKPYSAASKLSWFIWPANWTMYDSYACATVAPKGVGSVAFVNFYQRLHAAGFESVASDVRAILPVFANPLLAERVIDAFLMMARAKDLVRQTNACTSFVAALPPKIGEELMRANEAIASRLSMFAGAFQPRGLH